MNETSRIVGHVTWRLVDADGTIVRQGEGRNIITAVGDRMYAERGAGVTGAIAGPTGMKLGIGSTTPAKSGAGAALATYLSDSHQAIDSGYPASSVSGAARRITYQVTWPAGKATTASAITEAVIVNDTLTNATSAEANTISRIILSGVGSKAASVELVVTWTHDLLGA